MIAPDAESSAATNLTAGDSGPAPRVARYDRRGQPFSANTLHSLVAAIPYLVVLLFYSLVLHARLLLGEWPHYNNPDPKQIKSILFGLHTALLVAGFFLGLGSPMLWLCLMPAAERTMTLRTYLLKLAIFLVGLGFAALLVAEDPGGFLEWLGD